MLQQIEEILDRSVRPKLALHGGDLESLSFEQGVFRFRLLGQCAGCPSADVTTELLVAEAITAELPEVHQVVLERGASEELLREAKAILARSKQ